VSQAARKTPASSTESLIATKPETTDDKIPAHADRHAQLDSHTTSLKAEQPLQSQQLQSQALMQSLSMSKGCLSKRLPDFRRLDHAHIFNPLQVNKAGIRQHLYHLNFLL
jgi:hypothetical protein